MTKFVQAYGYLVDLKYLSAIENYNNVNIFINNNLQKILITYINKYLEINSNNIYIFDNNILKLNPSESSQLQSFFNTNSAPLLYTFPYDKILTNASINNLKIITFNLGYNVQSNISKGSESSLVDKCKQQYNGGLSNVKYNTIPLSQCTLNSINWIINQNADIICLQEINANYFPLMFKQFPTKYKYMNYLTTYIIYNYDKLGLGQLIAKSYIKEQNRPVMISLFDKLKLLVINLHAAHNIKLKEVIENTINNILPKNLNIDRIILTGDFNDAYGYTPYDIKILNKTLKQPSSSPNSCCYDSNFKYKGDYIFDSNITNFKFYGIPNDAKNILMSDHYPVVYY